MNKLFKLITDINIAGAKPPTFKFYEKDSAPQGWVETLNKAAEKFDVSQEYYQKMTGIQLAKNEEDKLNPVQTAQFAQQKNAFHTEQDKQTQAIYDALSAADNLQGFQKSLDTLIIDDAIDEALVLPILDEMIKGRGSV
jgi:hypothetical protein